MACFRYTEQSVNAVWDIIAVCFSKPQGTNTYTASATLEFRVSGSVHDTHDNEYALSIPYCLFAFHYTSVNTEYFVPNTSDDL